MRIDRIFSSGTWVSVFGSLALLWASSGWAAPIVTGVEPPDVSIVSARTSIRATFSEDMDPATITSENLMVLRFVGLREIAAGAASWFTLAVRNDDALFG